MSGFDLPLQQPSKTIFIKLTKRVVLSKLASVFDPIGAASAVLIKAKVAMQKQWQLRSRWDEELQQKPCEKWMMLLEELSELHVIKFDPS